MLRLSQTMSQRVSGAALLSRLPKNRAKSFSLRVFPITPSTLAGGDVEGGDQRLSAVTAIFELVPFDLARHHGLVRRNAFQGLDTGLLVDRDDAMGLVGSRRSLVDRTDIGALGIEGGIGLRGQPVPKAMRFEVGLFFKKRPTERCEMFGTRPRVASLRRQSRAGSNG